MSMAIVRSLLTEENPFNSTEEIEAWIADRNSEVHVCVSEIPFCDLRGWRFAEDSGNLCHVSGKFFSIVGADVYTNMGVVSRWQQPLINQPEVGVLGVLAKEIGGVMYFLLQAKIEPGNVNCVQLSPTLQATRSNYTCVHGGKTPAYLAYFRNVRPECVILDQLQSEQGARFLRKRNRNVIVRVDDEVVVQQDFRWLTLGQIKRLLQKNNIVNMDVRTVFSALRFQVDGTNDLSPFGFRLAQSESVMNGLATVDDILYRMSELKSRYELVTEKIPLRAVAEWMVTPYEIVREDRRFFRIIGVDVKIANREVAQWCQPIVQPMQEGLCVLFCKEIDGVLHFLLQAKVECGNYDVVELAPTIQCLTGDYKNPVGYVPEYLSLFQSGSCIERMICDTKQSEEGGRFYREQNRNVICLVNDLVNVETKDNFIWLTLGQIKEFLRFNNFLNIQVRSLISMLEYV